MNKNLFITTPADMDGTANLKDVYTGIFGLVKQMMSHNSGYTHQHKEVG